MSNKHILKNVHASLLRFCSDFSTQFPNMQVINFDAHADDSTVPQADVVGMSSLSISSESGFVAIKVLIGLSPFGDTNNFRLIDQADALFDALQPEERLPLLDNVTGQELSWMICQDGTTLLPVGGGNTRPLQYVAAHLLCGLTFK